MFDIGDSAEYGHVHMLLKGLDPGQRGGLLGQRPVREKFVIMPGSPFLGNGSIAMRRNSSPVIPRSIAVSPFWALARFHTSGFSSFS